MKTPIPVESQTTATALPFHAETCARIAAPAAAVFAHVDDHARLSSHMEKPSWWMGGGRMRLELDEGLGQRVGSHIRMSGRAFGVALALDEVVTQRRPPYRKVWQTVGTPRLIVIADYRMGLEIADAPSGSTLRVFIDYALPQHWFPFRTFLARLYARWCTRRMARDAAVHFRFAAAS
jgi:hypothetical protein